MTAPTVSVTAIAERDVLPDSFTIGASVSAEGADAVAAADALATRYAELEDAVAGLPSSVDVRRAQVGNHRGWRGKEPPEPIWLASRSMTLTGRDVDAAGSVLAALGGLPELQVDGPHWQVDRDNPVYGELQADAVRAARARAERYAAALGGTLGRLVRLSDPGGSDRPMLLHAREMSASARGYESMSFEPETLTVHATVEATWQLVPPE